MESLTIERTIELAREIVAEFGEDYVYPQEHKRPESATFIPSCVYVHEGCPSCLVAHILHRHGVSVKALADQEFRGAWFVASLANPDDKSRRFLDSVQSCQDGGETWGWAVESSIAGLDLRT